MTAAELAQLAELRSAVDSRTLEILERRRRQGVVRRRGWLVRRALAAADVAGLVLAFVVAELLFGHEVIGGTGRVDRLNEFVAFAASLPLWIVAAKLYGLYDKDEDRAQHTTVDDFTGVFHLVSIGAWVVFAGTTLSSVADPGLPKIGMFWAASIVAIPTFRALARAYCRRHVSYLQNTVIIGTGEVGQRLAGKVLQHPEYGINLVGFIDENPKPLRRSLSHVAVLGGLDALLGVVTLLDVERVILAFNRDTAEHQLDIVRTLGERDIQVDLVPRFFDLIGTSIDVHSIEGLSLMGLRPARLARSSRLLKRTLDLSVAVVTLVLLAPVFLAIAVAIKLDSPGPVFFRQTRVGRNGIRFRIWKFRTMSGDADERKAEFAHLNKHLSPDGDPRMFKIEDDPRVTKIGRHLRRSSLDELPQLINVVVGEMSLVGPRPLILDEDQHVSDWARRRLTIEPGITGLWQVLGRTDIPFEEMVRLDYVYVTQWSLLGDLKLVARTIPALVRRPSAL